MIAAAAMAMIALAALVFISIILAMAFRIVVSTNDVHIVQSKGKTVSYGSGQAAGNSYYAWPAWVPIIGIRIIQLPVSVFDIQLESYAAYDKGRVPFVIDIMAFFRIDDSNIAAQRVHSFNELKDQLTGILQGASRSILAKAEINEILEERAKYGGEFTQATNEQLTAWGVVNVKNIELMDIRDAQGSLVISNIMAKKKSMIEMESRVEVAKNLQTAQTAEIDAKRAVQVREQEANELVGVRTAEKEQKIGVAMQQAQQTVKEQEKLTAEKVMAVLQVNTVRQAEITREAQVVMADQQKKMAVIDAEGEKQKTITIAEGSLASAELNAKAIEVQGEAKGKAETAVLMAPVNSQIALAKEIGANDNYQTYLVRLRQIEATQNVGVKQAEALAKADIKIISNVGTPPEGLANVMDLFSAKGGTMLGAALEAVSNTPAGKAITEKLVGQSNGPSTRNERT